MGYRDLINMGELKACRLRGNVRVRVVDVDDFLSQNPTRWGGRVEGGVEEIYRPVTLSPPMSTKNAAVLTDCGVCFYLVAATQYHVEGTRSLLHDEEKQGSEAAHSEQ